MKPLPYSHKRSPSNSCLESAYSHATHGEYHKLCPECRIQFQDSISSGSNCDLSRFDKYNHIILVFYLDRVVFLAALARKSSLEKFRSWVRIPICDRFLCAICNDDYFRHALLKIKMHCGCPVAVAV